MRFLPTNPSAINKKAMSENNSPKVMRMTGFTAPPAKKIG